METIRLQYKTDDYGNALTAKVCWKKDAAEADIKKPIVLVLHAGGFMVGSADIVNNAQIRYLCERNCLVVIPNYRLCPQVDALNGAYADTDDAYTWVRETLPSLMQAPHKVTVDPTKIAAMGHSAGGTLALHLASMGSEAVRATVALYPSLYLSDPSTTAYKPYNKPPFNLFPDYEPTAEDWKSIVPDGVQVSEAALAVPGTKPAPRNLWQLDVLKHGRLMQVLSPDGNTRAIDPCVRFEEVGKAWPPTMFVSPELDDVPGSGPALIEKAVAELKEAGAPSVRVQSVTGQLHMFDMPPAVGTSDLDQKWQAVEKALNFLVEHLG